MYYWETIILQLFRVLLPSIQKRQSCMILKWQRWLTHCCTMTDTITGSWKKNIAIFLLNHFYQKVCLGEISLSFFGWIDCHELLNLSTVLLKVVIGRLHIWSVSNTVNHLILASVFFSHFYSRMMCIANSKPCEHKVTDTCPNVHIHLVRILILANKQKKNKIKKPSGIISDLQYTGALI